MAATEYRLSFQRMAEVAASLGTFQFASDGATLSVNSTATGYTATNIQSFDDLSIGPPHRTTGATSAEFWEFDFGSAFEPRWCLLSGVKAVGFKPVDSSFTTVLTLKGGTTTNPSDYSIDLTYNPTTGAWYALIPAGNSYRYWRITVAPTGTSPDGFYQIGRLALDTWTTLSQNFIQGYNLGAEDKTLYLENASGAVVTRRRPVRQAPAFRFQMLNGDSADLPDWLKLRASGGENRAAYHPSVPLFVCPNPSFESEGESGHLSPMFAYMTAVPRLGNIRGVANANGQDLFESDLMFREVIG